MSEPKAYNPSAAPPLTPHLPIPATLGGSASMRLQQPRWNTQQTSSFESQLSKSVPTTSFIPRLDAPEMDSNQLVFDYNYNFRTGLQTSKDMDFTQQGSADYFTTPRFAEYAPPMSGGIVSSGGSSADVLSNWSDPQAKEEDPWYNPAFSQPTNTRTTKKGKNQKKVDGKQPTFLTKLYQVLESPEYHHIIRWDDAGDIIIIERPDELAEKVLPQVYRQSRFASFSRQLNIYGWMRKVSLRHVESGIVDPDASTWSHTFLRRDSTKEEILGFKRRVPPRPSQAQKNAARLQQEAFSVSSDSESFNSPPEVYSSHMELEDTKHLMGFNPVDAGDMQVGTSNMGPSSGDMGPPSTHDDHASMLNGTGGSSSLDSHRRFSMPSNLGRPNLTAFQPMPSSLGRSFAMQQQAPVKSNRAAAPYKSMSLNAVYSSAAFGTPQSAPPGSYMFPGASNTLQIVQGNGVSTPSLTDTPAFSPASSLSGLFLDEAIANDDDPDRLTIGSADAPTFQLNDPSTWVRAGTGHLGRGMEPTQVAPILSVPQYYAFQPVAMGPNNIPLPSSSSSSHQHQQSQGSIYHPIPKDPASVDMIATTSNPLPTSSGTVSPGVYQSSTITPHPIPYPGAYGQANISPRGTAILSRPPTATKLERRGSMGPYSPPRHRASFTPVPPMPTRGLSSSSVKSTNSNRGEPLAGIYAEGDTEMKSALPSAYLPAPELFSGELVNESTPNELEESSL